MSFASDIKHELCKAEIDSSMKRAQLCALFLIRGELCAFQGQPALLFESSHAFITKHVYMLCKELFSVQPYIQVCKRGNLKKNNKYQLFILQKDLQAIESLRLFDKYGLKKRVPYEIVRSERNAKAFLQGAFLASGSISSPKTTNYHMEISTPKKGLALSIMKILERFSLEARLLERHGHWILYLKASDKIADFLSLINASESLFLFEDIRIQRDFYNQFTRLDNCEVANEMKSLKAARQQLSWIELIENSYNQKIDDKIQRVMEARKNNPEASIMELCNAIYLEHGEIISKSGMKHRLSKIKSMALECQGELDE